MKLIVGLGNPKKEYDNTRHNVGFAVLDVFCKSHNITLDLKKCRSLYAKTKINNHEVIIAKPQTYMNLSGEAVVSLAHFYKINKEDIIIIHDDIDLPLGKIRLRKDGSGGGHNGMKNIISNFNDQNIKRLRIGVGNNKLMDQKDYVLSKFKEEELKVMEKTYTKTSELLTDYLSLSFDVLMNKYNKNNE